MDDARTDDDLSLEERVARRRDERAWRKRRSRIVVTGYWVIEYNGRVKYRPDGIPEIQSARRDDIWDCIEASQIPNPDELSRMARMFPLKPEACEILPFPCGLSDL